MMSVSSERIAFGSPEAPAAGLGCPTLLLIFDLEMSLSMDNMTIEKEYSQNQ